MNHRAQIDSNLTDLVGEFARIILPLNRIHKDINLPIDTAAPPIALLNQQQVDEFVKNVATVIAAHNKSDALHIDNCASSVHEKFLSAEDLNILAGLKSYVCGLGYFVNKKSINDPSISENDLNFWKEILPFFMDNTMEPLQYFSLAFSQLLDFDGSKFNQTYELMQKIIKMR